MTLNLYNIELLKPYLKQKLEDAILNCKVVEVVFRNAIKQVKENIPDLIHQFILIAMKFKFANNLVEKMYNM